MEQQQYKYFAFISYSSKDTEWGRRVQRKLEGYRMPATLCSERGWERKPMSPVFFAPTDIQPGGLNEELQERLRASRHLIVICSPNSAKSEWVGREIEFFHQLGRTKQIHFFIVDGQPHSGHVDTECFNPVVEKLGLPEILGANIHEKIYRWPWMNRERAYAQLISKLLGVEFDAIWQRHRRQLIRKCAVWIIGIIAVLATMMGVWQRNQPVDVSVALNEMSIHNNHLPPLTNAIVTIALENETKTDTITALDGKALFANIPRRYVDKEVRIQVDCQDFLPVDTVLPLAENVRVDIRRAPTVYGDIHFRLWNPNTEKVVPHTPLWIDGHELTTDANGMAHLLLPIEQQRRAYQVTANIPLASDSIHMPCGPDDVVLMK